MLDEGQTTLKVARGDSFTLSVKVRQGDRIPEATQATYLFADGDSAGEPLRAMEGGEFRGEDRLGQSAVSFHGGRRRRPVIDPRRAGGGGATADLKSLLRSG